jgi:hypothetical protein
MPTTNDNTPDLHRPLDLPALLEKKSHFALGSRSELDARLGGEFIIGDHTAVELKAKQNLSPQDLKSLLALAEEKKLKRYLCVSFEPRPRKIAGARVSTLSGRTLGWRICIATNLDRYTEPCRTMLTVKQTATVTRMPHAKFHRMLRSSAFKLTYTDEIDSLYVSYSHGGLDESDRKKEDLQSGRRDD